MITWVSELFWFGQYAFSLINSKRKKQWGKNKEGSKKRKKKNERMKDKNQ